MDDHVAAAPNFDLSRLQLSDDEAAVLRAVGRVRQIREVVQAASLGEPRTIAVLLALRAKGALVPARVSAAPQRGDASAAMQEEVGIDDERKREILELEARLESADLFRLLGVPAGAEPAAVKAAFFELSRRVHPDRFFGRNIGSFKARVEKIFKRLVDAQQTLTDPDRRARYLAAHPELAQAPRPAPAPVAAAPAAEPPDPRRELERRDRLKRHPYLARHSRVSELVTRARASVAKGDFAAAHLDLVTASQADDRNAEVKSMLGEVKARADAQRSRVEYERATKLEQATDWTGALVAYKTASNMDPTHAEAAFAVARLMARFNLDARETSTYAQRAVEAAPEKAEYHLLLARLYEQAGMKQLSRKHFEITVKLDPSNLEAKKAAKGRWPF